MLLLSIALTAFASDVTTPEEHLGRPLGRDFELADWKEVSSYYKRLGEESGNVIVEDVGETTEGRRFLLATISSEANLARIDELRGYAARLADPRGLGAEEREDVLDQALPFLFISNGMHSTETAAPQFGMEFVHRLATSDEEPYASAREKTVVLVAACTNPDGLDHVVSWYRETVGTPYEAGDLLELYQHYAGHDNNRDWFMLSQNETRIVTRLLYSEWFPQVYWDVHQQGRTRERFFVPPFRDPLNPNLDAGIISGIGELGGRALFDLTREGLTGVSTGVSYDMWWNGGNRNVPVRHNIIGLLTEAASVNLASPVFLRRSDLSAPRGLGGYAPSNRFPNPWPGGWWRLRDIIEYEHAFARSLLGSLTREPRTWLENALEAAERAIAMGEEDAPRGWVVPATNRDHGATRRLMDALLLAGVEVHVAKSEVQADGRTWPAGSIVIQRAQPYGQHVKDLFEVQRYPEGDSPYDVAGWTLPLLLGVHRVEVMGEMEAEIVRVHSPEEATAGFGTRFQFPFDDMRDSDAWRAAWAQLANGNPISLGVRKDERGRMNLRPDEEDKGFLVEELPRIGIYSPWSGNKDEGWLRYAFDRFDVPYVTVRNEMLRAGRLSDFLDVLLFPSISGRYLDSGRAPGSVPPEFTRGLAPEGAAAIDDFVRGGGNLIAIGSAASWAIELFDLPLEDVTRGETAKDFSCPGSVLRAVPKGGSRHLAGLPDSIALFFSHSSAWKSKKAKTDPKKKEDSDGPAVLLRYAPTRVLQSGWIRRPETIEGHGAWVRANHGQGSVHLFGFRPQYRGWAQGTFALLFRAILFEA